MTNFIRYLSTLRGDPEKLLKFNVGSTLKKVVSFEIPGWLC